MVEALHRGGSEGRAGELAERFIRYEDLRPCTTAFIDTRTPGSQLKENFTIIGPGVAENPDQYVHLKVPHGFNIGGARQPPRCVNSQHSHFSAEVFVIVDGSWRMKTGHDGTDGFVEIGPGDVISFPTNLFRGFENVGQDVGFLFAVLGGDDPGRVVWAPYVFDAAAEHGLVLLDTGRLIDTTREPVPHDARLMPRTTPDEVETFLKVDSDGAESIVARASQLAPRGRGLNVIRGVDECPVVGVESPAEGMPAGRMGWSHGFQVRALRIAPGAATGHYARDEVEVFLGQRGSLRVELDDRAFDVGPGDTLSVPAGLPRLLRNASLSPAITYCVRGGDLPAPVRWLG